MPTNHAVRLSIRAKVLLLALTLALPPLIVVSALTLSSLERVRNTAVQAGKNALQTQAETNLVKRAADKARLYNATLANVQQQAEGVAAYAVTLIDQGALPTTSTERIWIAPDGPTAANEAEHRATVARARQFVPLLRSIVQRNPLVSLGYIALEEGGVVAFDHDIIDIISDIKPFDPRTRSWYVAARNAGKTVWIDTYVDANTKQLTTTCATPLYDDQNRFIGVVGFDILLGTIQEDILQLDMGAAGYAILINDQGKVLVRPDLSAAGVRWNQPFSGENLLESSDTGLRATVEKMINRQEGIDQLFYQGGNVYLAYAPIESAGWSVAMVIPETEIIRPAEEAGAAIDQRQEELRTQILALFVLALTAIPLLAALLSVLLTRPLRQLQLGTQRVATGDLAYRLEQTSADEIGDVTRSFNVMTEALCEKVAELEDNLSRLAILNEASNRFKALLSLPQLLESIPHSVCANLGFDRAVLYLLDNGTLRAVSASFGPDTEQQVAQFIAAANATPITLDSETVEADIVRTRQAVIIDNPWQHPRVVQAKQAITRSEAYVQVPIFGRQEQIIGLLSADYYYSRRPISARDAAQLLTFAGMAGLSIENTRLYNDLERQVAQRTSELRVALEKAQEADRLKGQFLAAISHELRTPLNAIIGFSTVMLDELDGPISALQREDLKTINRNGRFLLHLINELLDLARIDAGRIELDLQPLDVRALVDDVAETVQGLLHHKDIMLRVSLPPRLPRARADSGKIRQILLNLLSNAVKFTNEGTITITAQCVAVAGESAESRQTLDTSAGLPYIVRDGRRLTPYIAISVRDTGIGIAPEDLPLIFEEFRQVHNRHGQQRGSGLGLAICRRLIEAHGGRIWVESTPGQGSVFTCTIPCHMEARPQRQELPANEPAEVVVG